MYGYVGLCRAIWLFRVMYGYVGLCMPGLCMAMQSDVGLCMAM